MSYSVSFYWAWAQNHLKEEMDFVRGSVCCFKMQAAAEGI